MKVTRKPQGHWDIKENAAKEALKYATRTTFQKGSKWAYEKARIQGWLDEICQHMKIMKKLRGNYLPIQMQKIKKAGIPKDSPVGKRFYTICTTFWRRHNMNVTAEDFLALIKITKPNGEGAEVYDYINKKWINLLNTNTHLHHCHDFNTILFFTEMQTNQSMGHLGDTPFSFIELANVLISAGAKIPKDKLGETKEIIGKLYEAINKMDSGLCNIVPKGYDVKN